VRRSSGCGLQGQANRLGDLIVTDLTRRPRSRLVIQSLNPPFREPSAPFAHGVQLCTKPLADYLVLQTFGRRQHNPRSPRQSLRRSTLPGKALELLALLSRQFDRDRTPAHRLASCNEQVIFA
jgi:hypothetical protein